MKYLLDTCAVSDLLREKAPVVERFLATVPEDIAISTVTVMEMEYGLSLNPKIEERIRARIEAFFRSAHLLPFLSEEAKVTGKIWADLKKRGKMIGGYDLLIAGTALHHDLILVSSDLSDFRRVEGLKVEDWRR